VRKSIDRLLKALARELDSLDGDMDAAVRRVIRLGSA
jgi:transposase